MSDTKPTPDEVRRIAERKFFVALLATVEPTKPEDMTATEHFMRLDEYRDAEVRDAKDRKLRRN